jgi:hypothetical protein
LPSVSAGQCTGKKSFEQSDLHAVMVTRKADCARTGADIHQRSALDMHRHRVYSESML